MPVEASGCLVTIRGRLGRICEASKSLLHLVTICDVRDDIKSLVIIPTALEIPVAKPTVWRKGFLSQNQSVAVLKHSPVLQ